MSARDSDYHAILPRPRSARDPPDHVQMRVRYVSWLFMLRVQPLRQHHHAALHRYGAERRESLRRHVRRRHPCSAHARYCLHLPGARLPLPRCLLRRC